MRRIFFIWATCCVLAACATSEPLPAALEDRLKGKSPTEQRTILLEACLKEAGWQNHRRQGYSNEYLSYKPLCEKMYNEMEARNE